MGISVERNYCSHAWPPFSLRKPEINDGDLELNKSIALETFTFILNEILGLVGVGKLGTFANHVTRKLNFIVNHFFDCFGSKSWRHSWTASEKANETCLISIGTQTIMKLTTNWHEMNSIVEAQLQKSDTLWHNFHQKQWGVNERNLVIIVTIHKSCTQWKEPKWAA